MEQLMFYGGIAVLVLAFIMTVVMAVIASSTKKIILDRIKEKC